MQGTKLLWLQRHYYVLRLLRLGYNTLLLDVDCVIFSDPYVALKGRLINATFVALADTYGGFAQVRLELARQMATILST